MLDGSCLPPSIGTRASSLYVRQYLAPFAHFGSSLNFNTTSQNIARFVGWIVVALYDSSVDMDISVSWNFWSFVKWHCFPVLYVTFSLNFTDFSSF